MKALVVGIGGVGGYFGGKLARAYASLPNHEVVFIVRGEHMKKIAADGLAVTTKDEGSWTARPDLATDDPGRAGTADLVLFCVKGYDLEASAEVVKPCINDGTVCVSLLNGIDNAERLSAVIDRGHILDGCVYISSVRTAPGAVAQMGGPCTLFFGPRGEPLDRYRPLESFLQGAGIKATLSDDITAVLWSKYLFVGPMGGVTSLAEAPMGDVLADDGRRTLLEGMMREVESVARTLNVALPADIVERSMNMAAGFPRETKTSIQLDFERGNRTELDTFTGYLVKTAKKAGINTPLHEQVYHALTEREGR